MFKTLLSVIVLCYVYHECSAIYQRPICAAIQLKNGRVRYRQKGRFVKFTCNTGFIIAGEKYSTCIRGQWDTQIPKCVRPTCSKVRPPTNGLIYSSHRGAVLHFFCKAEYQLRGSNVTYCDGKRWDNNLPNCIKTNTTPKYECNFESEDLCGWDHDLNHDFDWRRMQFSTPSGHIGTGPSYDHTKGEGKDGYYMYIESSSRFENDTARLISPVYDKTDNETCFEFYYHMYGLSTGSLRVYMKKANDSWDLDPQKAFFSKSGNQGDAWYRSFNILGAVDQEFQIVIEGVRGPSYVSDIAVDDVKLIRNCVPEEETSTTTEMAYTETFATMESCENRCDGNPLYTAVYYQITCDCDADCIEKFTCCPDYVAFCILAPTDDTTLAKDTSSSTESENTTPAQDNTNSSQAWTLLKEETAASSAASTTTTAVAPQTTVNVSKYILPVANNSFPKFPIIHTIPTEPPLIILSPKPGKVIVQKVLTTTTEVYYHKPTKAAKTENDIEKTIIDRKDAFVDDMLPVPETVTYKSNVATAEMETDRADHESSVEDELEKYYGDVENSVRIKGSMEKEKSSFDAKSISSIGAVVIFVLVGVFVGVYVARKRGVGSCIRMGRKMRNSANGDSQSDVRFLTSDEQLNFTWIRSNEESDM